MTWTVDEWDAFCGLVEEAWPGSFDDAAARSWRFLLDPLEPQMAAGGLRRLLLEGHKFRPSASEFLAAARSDPSAPTFDEAYHLIFGPGGVLHGGTGRPAARREPADDCERCDGTGMMLAAGYRVACTCTRGLVPVAPARWASERERRAAQNTAALERAAQLHPLVAAFIDRQGIDRLRDLPVNDADWGDRHRRDLQHAWERHVEAFDGRQIAALASGRRGELARLDPLAALGLKPEPAELTSEVTP